MRSHELESWVLEIIDRVEKRQPVEDSRVELKTDWIKPVKAARRIAGHANAARGDRVLWIIGVDENNGVIGVDHKELSNWYSEISRHFDGVAPNIQDLNIPINGKTVVALLFDTERAPFVIKNPDGGKIQHEVPWREGTGIRSAKRKDLLRILSPIVQLPVIELFEAYISFGKNMYNPKINKWVWSFDSKLYFTPQSKEMVIFPFHKCQVTIQFQNTKNSLLMENIDIRPPYRSVSTPQLDSYRGVSYELDSATMDHTQYELIVKGPGLANMSAKLKKERKISRVGRNLLLEIKLYTAISDYPTILNGVLTPTSVGRDQIGQWKLKD